MRALVVILVVIVLGGGCASRQREQGVAVGGGRIQGGDPFATESPITIVEDAANVGAYIPPTRDVPVGTTVTWSNDTASAHTVDFGDPAFQDSGDLAPGQRHGVAFNAAGTYAYSCRLHPQMTGAITAVAG